MYKKNIYLQTIINQHPNLFYTARVLELLYFKEIRKISQKKLKTKIYFS